MVIAFNTYQPTLRIVTAHLHVMYTSPCLQHICMSCTHHHAYSTSACHVHITMPTAHLHVMYTSPCLQHICMSCTHHHAYSTPAWPYLWSNVVGSATKRRCQFPISDVLFAHAKICHLYMAFRIQQDVVQLEISATTTTRQCHC